VSRCERREKTLLEYIELYLKQTPEDIDKLKKYFSEFEIRIVTDLENAFEEALKNSKKGDSILISPAAANFYSRFIKGKKSIRKIISSFD